MRNRIWLALALSGALAGSPLPADSQTRPSSVLERRVTVTFSQAPLESVLRTLRRQYGVRISYSNTALKLTQPVTLSAQNQPLRAVLNAILADKGIGYELVGDQIVLHAVKPAKPNSPDDSSSSTGNKSPAAKPAAPDAPAAPGKPMASSKASVAKPAPVKQPSSQGKNSGPASNSKPETPDKPLKTPTVAGNPAPVPVTPAAPAATSPDSVAKPAAEAAPEAPARPTRTKAAQVSFLGPLGSNGLRSGQTVNKVSVNVLGGYAAGVDGFEAAGLFNVDRDSVRGVQVAGLANVVGRHFEGFQGAGLLNVLGGTGTGWQAAGLLNVATRPVSGAQTAGLFNYAGPGKKNSQAADSSRFTTPTPTALNRRNLQAAGLFNVALSEVRGVQAAGLFNAAGTVHGVQLAGLLNVADSVDGVSIAPLNFVRRGYHRLEATNTESWPVSASLKLGGSAGFYTFFTGAYDGFGSRDRCWALGYGAGTELLARRRISLSLDAVALHVNEESRGWTDDLNLHNQLRLLVGVAPRKAGGRFRIVAGPTVSVLVTQRYDADRGQVYSSLLQNRRLWLDEGNVRTRVLGWMGYCVGIRL